MLGCHVRRGLKSTRRAAQRDALLVTKRLLVLLVLLWPVSALAQPVPMTWRPPTTCSTNDALKWSGTAWVCSGGATVTGTGTTNTTTKFTGVSTIGNGWALDDATTWGVSGKFTITEASGAITGSSYEQLKGTPTINNDGITFGFTAPNGIIASKNSSGAPASNLVFQTTTSGGTPTTALTLFFDQTAAFAGAVTVGSSLSNTAGLLIGKSATSTTATDVGTDLSLDGTNLNWRAKLNTGGHISAYFGAGANAGNSNLWLDVNGSGGLTTFPLAVTINGNTTFGDAYTDTTTVNGRYVQVDGQAAATATRFAINLSEQSTYDTTAGALSSYGVVSSISSSRSAGANALTNTAIYGNSSGAQTNYAIFTDNGDNIFNQAGGSTTAVRNFSVNGNTTLGDATSDTTTINGALTITEDLAGATATITPVAAAASTWGFFGQVNGTVDTTASLRSSYGVIGESYTTRSGGANNLVNYGGFFDAVGGQVAYAVYADRGNVYANATSGTTGIGTAPTSGVQLNVVSTGAVNAGNFQYSGTTQTAQRIALTGQNTGTYNTTSGTITDIGVNASSTATRSSGSNALTNVAVYATASGAQVNQAIFTSDGDVFLNNNSGSTTANLTFQVNGATTLGDSATADSTTGNGWLFWTATTSNSGAGWKYTFNPTAQTADRYGLDLADSATFDTTSGVLASYGIRSVVTSSRSAGANNLINYAAYFSATGGQGNTALITENGDVYLNRTSGVTTVHGAATFDSTVDVTGALNGYTQLTKLLDQDVTNSTTLTDDTNLTFSVTAGKIYAIDAFLIVSGSDATGAIKDAWAVAAGTMDCTGTNVSVSVAGASQNVFITATAAAATTAVTMNTRADASLPHAVRETLACKVSNTTTLKHQFAENSAVSAKVARVMAGSYIRYKQLN